MKWSEEAWKASEDIYEKILQHPFVRGLADGTLPAEKFRFYIEQDALYLRQYFRVLSHIASRLDDISEAETFIKFASDGVAVEKALHGSFLKDDRQDEAFASPSCSLYTSTLLSQCLEPVEVEAAAVLPCFWIYQRVGEWIYASVGECMENPYSSWIQTYADKTFMESTERAIEICDRLAENASVEVRERMTKIFRYCARMEWLFWDSAWNLEAWKV
ncbi:MAG: thiaminase II [Bacteroidales bacterium]|nr:thiaminase II [Bacteroidales bacterium]